MNNIFGINFINCKNSITFYHINEIYAKEFFNTIFVLIPT